ncbi:uncharacterized protein [Ptychodera flava]|uniref:uncharacterized protein n=1 Tax=Ptychodera flava TaxID=63121 RepID=UPI003969D864
MASSQPVASASQAFVAAHGGPSRATAASQPPENAENSRARTALQTPLGANDKQPRPETPRPQIGPQESQPSQADEMKNLKTQIQKLQDMAETASVEDALSKVMELAHTPLLASRVQLVSALRALVDRATVAAHPKLPRFRAVLAQFESNDFGQEAGRLLILLLGNKEEEEIVSKVSKFMRHSSSSERRNVRENRYEPYTRRKINMDTIKCFSCGQLGHMARACPQKK